MEQAKILAMGNDWHYHTMRDAAGELIWMGQYDLYSLWNQFGIPDDLSGQSVIDIGTAGGFFAFEMEKRNAGPVVATELADVSDWDARRGVSYDGPNIPANNQNDFREVHSRLGSKVELRFGNICQPLHESLGTFDWVIFGSLMTHIRDLMLALENVFKLTKENGRAVIISSYLPGQETCALHWINTPRPFDWWVPTKNLIPKMLQSVGFKHIEETGDFDLVHANGTVHRQACWHAFA